jgi:hypothetical protein
MVISEKDFLSVKNNLKHEFPRLEELTLLFLPKKMIP